MKRLAHIGCLSLVGLGVLWACSGCQSPRGKRWERKMSDAPTSGEVLVTMPGASFSGPLPALTDEQRRLGATFRAHVEHLAGKIGERNVSRRYAELNQAADYIEAQFEATKLALRRQSFMAGGRECHNLECVLPGAERPDEILVIGAHYDSVEHCPGANDNGSGVAALLTLAKELSANPLPCTVRFVAFANEEAPYFGTQQMGSWRYAARCRQQNEKLVGMISLETIGYFSDQPGSQHYPPPFNRYYPSVGNFIGVVGNTRSADLVKQAVTSFREHAQFPSEGGALPEQVDGVGWSDHWAFWRHGYPALMITDTAPFRYPHYHKATDTPDKLQHEHVGRVLAGLKHVVRDMAK